MQSITVLESSKEGWRPFSTNVQHYMKTCDRSLPSYILIEEDLFTSHTLPKDFVDYFGIPAHLFAESYTRSNGFFSYEESHDNLKLKRLKTWFRCLIKFAYRNNGNEVEYKWHEMTFFSLWTPRSSQILCIATPRVFNEHLQHTLAYLSSDMDLVDPYSLHIPLVEVLLTLYDQSVWSMRDLVRDVEKHRALPGETVNFIWLHETARHAIHSSETIDRTAMSLDAMLQHSSAQKSTNNPSTQSSDQNTTARLQFQIQMLRGLLLRSQANKDRLSNEVTLAFNTIAQSDNAAMKTVAIVTMAFLPATFIAALFSMSFFNFTPGSETQHEKWSVSEMIWIYWAFVIPLTAMTLGLWVLRHKGPDVIRSATRLQEAVSKT